MIPGFEEQRKQMSEEFEKARRKVVWIALVNALLGAFLIGFGCWVIIKLMQFFGVI